MTDICIVGEAWGREEEEAGGLPFVGSAGRLLAVLLSQSGIRMTDCYLTNVFNLRPQPSNDVINLCGPKAGGIPGYPSLIKGKYARAEYAPELTRLYKELKNERPVLIIATGATAAWALLKTSGIRAIRGAPTVTHPDVTKEIGQEIKVLPTYHPSAINREWKLRPILLADLDKARRESRFSDLRRPTRAIWIEPDLDDITRFLREHIGPNPDLSIDIETIGDQITCIGFAPTIDLALVIPFVDATKPGRNYWPTKELELRAWELVKQICAMNKRIVFQNGLYDMHFLWRRYGITVPYAKDDTMLLHHALQPELEKGLGFLGSIYTDEASWKFMRAKHDTVKRED